MKLPQVTFGVPLPIRCLSGLLVGCQGGGAAQFFPPPRGPTSEGKNRVPDWPGSPLALALAESTNSGATLAFLEGKQVNQIYFENGASAAELFEEIICRGTI